MGDMLINAPVNLMLWVKGKMGNPGESDERHFYTPRDSGMTNINHDGVLTLNFVTKWT